MPESQIEFSPDQHLSSEWSSYIDQIKASKLPAVRIKARADKNLAGTTSKFGGLPYWPTNLDYPLDDENNPMALLAQINFEQIPQLPDYPDKGLLQIFISSQDDTYGADFDNMINQAKFKIIFHDNPNPDLASSNIPQFDYNSQDCWLPITTEHRLSFELVDNFVSRDDIRFENFLTMDDTLFELCQNDHEQWYNQATGHKIGGYAYFTQSDPRDWPQNAGFKDSILLLQIDTDGETICWGDAGVANFFITSADLKARNFTKVLYNWDCM